jgi:predicted short-subunit dehydrogenase-like oxidoreductase (DUF2520 family)
VAPDPARTFVLVGPGRAGTAVAAALLAAGWVLRGVVARDPSTDAARVAAGHLGAPLGDAADLVPGTALVVLATPDRVVAEVAATLRDVVAPTTLVVHLAGALGVDVLAGLECRTGALHPLQTLRADAGAATALAGAHAAVAGDAAVEGIATDLGMVPFRLADADRAAYHAAAAIASNHLVALLAQVDACTSVPLDAFLPLVRTTVDNVAASDPSTALTGPVRRGDVDTVRSHLAAIPPAERAAYRALARRAARLAGRDEDLSGVLA